MKKTKSQIVKDRALKGMASLGVKKVQIGKKVYSTKKCEWGTEDEKPHKKALYECESCGAFYCQECYDEFCGDCANCPPPELVKIKR